MKKLFTIMMIAIVAMGTAFATAPTITTTGKATGDGSTSGLAETTVTLDLSDYDLEGYRLGFVGDEPTGIGADHFVLDNNVPETHATEIKLTYDPTTATAATDKTYYVYWIVRSGSELEVRLEAASLSSETVSDSTIGYTLSDLVGEKDSNTTLTSGSGHVAWKVTPGEDGFVSGSSPFTIETDTIAAGQKADDWKGTMTLTLTTGA